MSLLDCHHASTGPVRRACRHLLDTRDDSYLQHFTGTGQEFTLVCYACHSAPAADAEASLRTICPACFKEIQDNGTWEGISGRPEVKERPAALSFQHEMLPLPLPESILDIQPVAAFDQNLWIAVTASGQVVRIDLDEGDVDLRFQLREQEPGLSLTAPVSLHVSRRGEMAAVVNTKGRHGVVIDLTAGKMTMTLERDAYRFEHCVFPVDFFEHEGRLLLIHATAWNRLDVSEPATGRLLTERSHEPVDTVTRPQHYLDYFHCGLSVSPSQDYVADNGWVWSPVGIVTAWSLTRWLRDNVWESEDGASKKSLSWRHYYWDGPLCWLPGDRLAVWGYGQDDEWLIPAVLVYDAATGAEERWFAGPKGSLVFDDYLFSSHPDEGTSVWDHQSGERLYREEGFCPGRYHPGAKCFVTLRPGGVIQVSKLCGLPVDGRWLTGNDHAGARLARAIAGGRAFERLPILADALEEAGCEDAALLGHCRRPGPHGRSCWVVHRLLHGK